MSNQCVSVKTDGDMFASFECGAALVELSKDGDSPNCPNSWTWGLWYDGEYLSGTAEEGSFAESVSEALNEVGTIIDEFRALQEHIDAYEGMAYGNEHH